MSNDLALAELVRAAQSEDCGAMDALATECQPKVCAFIYRVTLDYDLTQDLCQETMLTVIKSIQQCKYPDRFWSWLYRIAQNTVMQHYRSAARREATTQQARLVRHPERAQEEGYQQLLRNELAEKAMVAMQSLGPQHRTILSLRCLEQLSYVEIAHALACSEVKARVSFHRAKQALRRCLKQHGVDVGLLGALLLLFGKMTASDAASAAQLTLPADYLMVDGLTRGRAWLRSPQGAVVGGVLILGILYGFFSHRAPQRLSRQTVKSVHFTMQSLNRDPNSNGSESRGAYEQWYYFPQGPDGPLFARMQRWSPNLKHRQCAWLLTPDAHYYYFAGRDPVAYLRNRTWFWGNNDVRRLPSDPPSLTAALDQLTADSHGIDISCNPDTNLPAQACDNRFPALGPFITEYEYNTLEPTFFTHAWPPEIIKDTRDPMHKRGWTYFTLEGDLEGRTIQGQGRIPFHFKTLDAHRPWLSLQVDGKLRFTDTAAGAYCHNKKRHYPSQAFFDGLCRPWTGLHVYDTLRRDAAICNLPFDSQACHETMKGQVSIHIMEGYDSLAITYHLDLENDLIDRIEFVRDMVPCGTLHLHFLQEVEDVGNQFLAPPLEAPSQAVTASAPGVTWLIDLARECTDKQLAATSD